MSFYPSAPEVPSRRPVGRSVEKSKNISEIKLSLDPFVSKTDSRRHNGIHDPPPSRPPRSERRRTTARDDAGVAANPVSGTGRRDTDTVTPTRHVKNSKNSKSDGENSVSRGSIRRVKSSKSNITTDEFSKQVRLDSGFDSTRTKSSTRTPSLATDTGTRASSNISKFSRYKSNLSNFSNKTFSTTSRSTSGKMASMLSFSGSSSAPVSASTSNLTLGTTGETNSRTHTPGGLNINAISLSHLEEQLFVFCKIPLGDFETCMAWLNSHPPPSVDYSLLREKMLWQTYKTFERLLRRDFEERHMKLVREFAEQCVGALAILDYASDCGWERAREYVRHLVLTPELARMSYLSRMMKLPPSERLEFIIRPVPDQLHKLKFFCLLYDHLYEKIEQETRHRMEKSLLDKFHTRLENVQARLSKGIAGGAASGSGPGATNSPIETRASGTGVGWAL